MPRVRVSVIHQELNVRNWTIAKLARTADMSNTTVHNIVNGVTDPNLRTLGSIARALNVRVADLIIEDDEEEPRLTGLPQSVQGT